jgi:hypothetical protein
MRAVPTTYIINRAGMIVAQGIGVVDFEGPDFGQYLEGLLTKPSPASLRRVVPLMVTGSGTGAMNANHP